MKYTELAPQPALRPYVHLIWCLELDVPGEFGPPERIAPDGIAELVCHYRGRMAVRFAGDDVVLQPRTSVVCQTRRYLDITAPGAAGFVSVRFRPWGALHFLHPPLSELADQVVPAYDIWGGSVGALEARLSDARNLNERVAIVEQFLLDQLRRHRKEEVETAIRAVWRHKGDIRAAALCRELGISDRTAQRVFTAAVGMPPKGYARLTRFLHACYVLRKREWNSLTEVGLKCGYYDQAHFIGDFKAHSGMTPGDFLDARAFSFLAVE